jgi:hypothetical protein
MEPLVLPLFMTLPVRRWYPCACSHPAADCIRPDNPRPSHSDRRAEPRLKVGFDVNISGEFGSRGARGLDLHNSGALILATRPLAR